MTKKDGDKLREMARELRYMSSDYHAAQTTNSESDTMWSLAEGVKGLLEGKTVKVTIR